MFRRMMSLMLVLLLTACVAAAETTENTSDYGAFLSEYQFEQPEFDEAVLYEDRTGKPFDLTISVKDVSEESITIQVDNRCEGPVNITFTQYSVDDAAIYRYQDWTVATNTSRKFELDVPKYMLKWAGKKSVGEISLYSVTIMGMGPLRGSLNADTLSARLTEAEPETAWQGDGYVLCEGEWGNLTLLGIDYDDYYPPVFFRLENHQPTWEQEWARGVTFYSGAEAKVTVTSVNGIPMNRMADMNIAGEGAAIGHAYLEGFEITGVSGEHRRAFVGRVDEMTLSIRIQAGGGNGVFEETKEITVRPAEIGAVIVGEPFADWENRCFAMSYDDFPDEWKEYYARQQAAE